MAFGNLGKVVENAVATKLIDALPVSSLLQGAMSRVGISLEPSTLQAIANDASIKTQLKKSASTLLGLQNIGNLTPNAVHAPLGQIAETILAKTSNTDVSKNDLVQHLKNELSGHLGL